MTPTASLPRSAVTRRRFLEGAVVLSGALWLPGRSSRASDFAPSEAARSAIATSPLVYVSPLKSDGSESACHGEVWFVPLAGDLWVVTAHDRWRAEAIRRGLDRARIWVGDFGVWKRAEGRYRSAPGFVAEASLVDDEAAQARVLAVFGEKYADEWGKWGPRFREGLVEGSRVLIRYRPAAG